MTQSHDGDPVNSLKKLELPDLHINIAGIKSVLDEASTTLGLAVQRDEVIEPELMGPLPATEDEIEAAQLFDRVMAIREVLDDVFPRLDGETWSLLITGVEQINTLPDTSINDQGIATALDRAAQHEAGARAIEVTLAIGAADTLLEDDSKVSEADLERMPSRLRTMVRATTETLDQVIPRLDKESWSTLVNEQAQALIDNS